MAIQPFDIEGQLPIEINFQTQVTVENFSVNEARPVNPKGSALGVTGLAVGIAVPQFSFRMPVLSSPQMTELNAQKLISSLPGGKQKFTLAFRNSVGARKTLVGCRLSNRGYTNTPMQGEAGAEFSGTAEQMLDT